MPVKERTVTPVTMEDLKWRLVQAEAGKSKRFAVYDAHKPVLEIQTRKPMTLEELKQTMSMAE